MAFKIDEELELPVTAALSIQWGILGFSAELALYIGGSCPEITKVEYCPSADSGHSMFCCWQIFPGFLPRLWIILPFFLSVVIGGPPWSVGMLAFSVAIIFGELFFRLALGMSGTVPGTWCFYAKILDFHLGDMIEDFMDCDDCLGAFADIVFQISVEYFEIAFNNSPDFLNIGSTQIQPGFLLDIRNLNLWDIIFFDRVYIKFQAAPNFGFELKAKMREVEIKGILTIGAAKFQEEEGYGEGTGVAIQITILPTEYRFYFSGGISILGGLMSVDILIDINPEKILARFEFNHGPLSFKVKIEGTPPYQPFITASELEVRARRGETFQRGRRLNEFLERDAQREPIELPPVIERECVNTTVAIRLPTKVEILGECVLMPKPKLQTTRDSNFLNGTILYDKEKVNFLTMNETFGAFSCKDNEFLTGFAIEQCEDLQEYRVVMQCLRHIGIRDSTDKYSKFIGVEDDKDFGLSKLVELGEVSCDEGFAFSRLAFTHPPDRNSEHRSRGFSFKCMRSDPKNSYHMMEDSKMEVAGICTVPENEGFLEAQYVLSSAKCPDEDHSTLQSFRLQTCISESGVEGYQFVMTCIEIIYHDKDPNSPANKRLPVQGMMFNDIESNMIQMRVCFGVAITDPENSTIVIVDRDEDTLEMVCPGGYAMIAYRGEWIECFKPFMADEEDRELLDEELDRKWSAPFTVQKSMIDCAERWVVGMKCSGIGCYEKRIMCQGIKKPDKVYVGMSIEATFSLSLGEFLAEVFFPWLIELFQGAAKAFRGAADAMDVAKEEMEKAKADLDRIEAETNAKLDAKQAELRRAKADLAPYKKKRDRLQKAHDQCSWFECVKTFAKLAACEVIYWIKQAAFELAIWALDGVKATISVVVEIAKGLLDAAQGVLSIAADVFNAMADGFQAMGDYMVNALQSDDPIDRTMFDIEHITFGTSLTTAALTVWWDISVTLIGFHFETADEFKLSWEGVWESFKSKVENVITGALGLRRRKHVSRKDMMQIRHLMIELGRERTYRRDRRSTSHDENDRLALYADMLVDRRRTRGPWRRIEHIAHNFFAERARERLDALKTGDKLRRTFDSNRGLDTLCTSHEHSNGYRSIARTNSVPRVMRFDPVSIPSCLFSSNPELRTLELDGFAGGILPPLPEGNELRVLTVRSMDLQGSLGALLRNASVLKILHLSATSMHGELTRSLLSPSLESLSLVNNRLHLDPAAMFDALQDQRHLEQVFWDKNPDYTDSRFSSARKTEGLSTLATRVTPEFSVLYGAVTIAGLKDELCGTDICTESNLGFQKTCFKFPCANKERVTELEMALAEALGVPEVQLDGLINGMVTFSARMAFRTLRQQTEILQGFDTTDIQRQVGATMFKARFGCTPGAVGPSCEYICSTGWRRHGSELMPTLLYPQCTEPIGCNVDCSNTIRSVMDICTEVLYEPAFKKLCKERILEAQEVCPTCRYRSLNAADYVGQVSRTLSGISCVGWMNIEGFEAPDLRDWDHNYCRNSYGQEKANAWCYIDTYGNWELCDVGSAQKPRCRDDGSNCIGLALAQFIEILR